MLLDGLDEAVKEATRRSVGAAPPRALPVPASGNGAIRTVRPPRPRRRGAADLSQEGTRNDHSHR